MVQSDLNHYQILGVTSSAKNSEIKAAYKKHSLFFHPDRNPNKRAKQQYEKICLAYKILSNSKNRRQYDSEIPLKIKSGIRNNRDSFNKRTPTPISTSHTTYKINRARSILNKKSTPSKSNQSNISQKKFHHSKKQSISKINFRRYLQYNTRLKPVYFFICLFLIIFLSYLFTKWLLLPKKTHQTIVNYPQAKTKTYTSDELHKIAQQEFIEYRNMPAYSLTHELRLRQSPTTKSPVIRVIDQYDELKIINLEDDNSWVKVKVESGQIGYVWETYVGYGDGYRAFDLKCDKYPEPRPKHGVLLQKNNMGSKQIDLSNDKETDALFNFYNHQFELEHSIYLHPKSTFILTGISNKSYQVKMSHGKVYNHHCGIFSFPDGEDVIFWLE